MNDGWRSPIEAGKKENNDESSAEVINRVKMTAVRQRELQLGGFFSTPVKTGQQAMCQLKRWKTINWNQRVKSGYLKHGDIFKPLSCAGNRSFSLSLGGSVNKIPEDFCFKNDLWANLLKDVEGANDGSASFSWTPVWGCRHTGERENESDRRRKESRRDREEMR